MFEAINWPEEMAPGRCPIHFTNELEVAASPETIRSLVVDPNQRDSRSVNARPGNLNSCLHQQ
jgi:hypothetical protein